MAGVDRQLPEELRVTDLAIAEWARLTRDRSPYGNHPLEVLRLLKDGAVLGGEPPQLSEVIMRIDKFLASRPRAKRFVDVWYRQGGSNAQKARRLFISADSIYWELRVVLRAVRDYLIEFGHRV